MENILNRTSIRKFLPRDVEESDIEQMLRSAMSAPSACNRQPWEFIVIKDKSILRELAHGLPFAAMTAEASAAFAVCGNLNNALEGEGREFWVQDTSAATENLLLAAHALGLGAVWTGVYPINERVKFVSRILHLPEHIIPLNIIPVGYPAVSGPPKQKFDPAKVHRNCWHGDGQLK